MPPAERTAYFERIYATDLRYVPDCYKLCGDAHCCNFSRYKQKFAFMGRSHFQELPLLPGEFEFLRDQGYLAQFQDHELRQISKSRRARSVTARSFRGARGARATTP